jgi:hypothetical protein
MDVLYTYLFVPTTFYICYYQLTNVVWIVFVSCTANDKKSQWTGIEKFVINLSVVPNRKYFNFTACFKRN